MRTICDCGAPVPPYCGKGQRPLYCSVSCRRRAYYRRKTKTTTA
ncbi:hypothetical protein [Streptomyces sp. NPDC057238]